MLLYERAAFVSQNISKTLIHCKPVSSAKINYYFLELSFACHINLSLRYTQILLAYESISLWHYFILSMMVGLHLAENCESLCLICVLLICLPMHPRRHLVHFHKASEGLANLRYCKKETY